MTILTLLQLKINNMKLYTSPSCPVCKSLKAYLEQNKILFKEIDVTKNEEERNSLEILTLPQLRFQDKLIIGFNKTEVDKLIKEYGEIHKDANA